MRVVGSQWIECPECGEMQLADISDIGGPWACYVHECERCEYMITESDWNAVAPPVFTG